MQVLEPGRQKEPSFSQRVSAGIGQGLNFGQQIMQQKQAQEQIQKENEAYYKMFGEDISGIQDPKTRQDIFSNAMQAKNQRALQELKGEQQNKKKPLNSLQESQQKLAEAKIGQVESQNNLFNQFVGKQSPQNQIGSSENRIADNNESPLTNYDDNQLNQLAGFAGQPGQQGIIGNIAKSELEKRDNQRKEKQRTFEADRAYHAGYTKDIEKRTTELRASIPKKEMALNFARDAIESGELEYFSLDKLADVTGSDLFRTAKGAQLITAGKENLLGNMSRVSARAQNIWFEQRLNSMFPKIGQSNEANLTTQEMLEGELAMDKAYLDEYDRLSEEDQKNFGFERKDVDKRARASIKPLEQHIMRRTSYRMKEIEEQEQGLKSLQDRIGKNVVKGTPLTLAMASLYKKKFGNEALKVAEKNGYYIPTMEEFESYQKRPQEFREEL